MLEFRKIRRFLKLFLEISFFKTIYFNAVYVSFPQMLRLPFFVSRHVRIRSAKGKIILGSYNTGSVFLGFDCVGVFDNKKSRSIWEMSDGCLVEFKGNAILGHGFKVCVQNEGRLVIGNRFKMTAESTIICYKSIEIGDSCLFSWDCLIMDTDFHSIYSLNTPPNCELLNENESIVIEDKVWLCCRSMILKGSHIPKGCVVAAGATITKELSSSNSIYYNNRLIKQNIRWDV